MSASCANTKPPHKKNRQQQNNVLITNLNCVVKILLDIYTYVKLGANDW